MKTIDDIERKLFNADNRVERMDILRQWAEEIIVTAANMAQIQEERPIDDDYQNGTELSVYSGGYIRDEHYVTVNMESILKLKEQL